MGRDVMQRDEVARRGVEEGPQLSLLGIWPPVARKAADTVISKLAIVNRRPRVTWWGVTWWGVAWPQWRLTA